MLDFGQAAAGIAPAAKIFAVFVVLMGFGVLSLVTASIAAMWVHTEERRIEHESSTTCTGRCARCTRRLPRCGAICWRGPASKGQSVRLKGQKTVEHQPLHHLDLEVGDG